MSNALSSIPQDDNPDEPKKALRLAKQPGHAPGTIQSLVRNRWYVTEDSSLMALADDFADYPTIPAVGVTSRDGSLLGVIIRQDLLDLLGRPFGRDVVLKETVVRVAQLNLIFEQNEAIAKVSEAIGREPTTYQQGFFPVRSAKDQFSGLFSIQDVLLHLAQHKQGGTAAGPRFWRELQVLESPGYDLLCSSLRLSESGSDFSFVRQVDAQAWTFGSCSAGAAHEQARTTAAIAWGASQSFDFQKGLVPFSRLLNGMLLRGQEGGSVLRGMFAEFHSQDASLTLNDHGDGEAYLWRNGQLLRLKTNPAPSPLGLQADLGSELYRYQLKAGDLLVLLNRSLLEQRNPQGAAYKPVRVKAILDANPAAALKELRNLIHVDLRNFAGKAPQEGEATLVLLKLHEL